MRAPFSVSTLMPPAGSSRKRRLTSSTVGAVTRRVAPMSVVRATPAKTIASPTSAAPKWTAWRGKNEPANVSLMGMTSGMGRRRGAMHVGGFLGFRAHGRLGVARQRAGKDLRRDRRVGEAAQHRLGPPVAPRARMRPKHEIAEPLALADLQRDVAAAIAVGRKADT